MQTIDIVEQGVNTWPAINLSLHVVNYKIIPLLSHSFTYCLREEHNCSYYNLKYKFNLSHS